MGKTSVRSWLIATSVPVLLLVLMGSTLVEGASGSWRLTGFTKYRDGLFADTGRISHPSEATTAIWVRIAPSAKSKYLTTVNDYLESVGKGGQGFKYIEILCEFNCSTDSIRFLKFVYLNKSGWTIHTADESGPSWFHIPPGNLWGSVEKLACGKPEK
jgi:hypothetical protein